MVLCKQSRQQAFHDEFEAESVQWYGLLLGQLSQVGFQGILESGGRCKGPSQDSTFLKDRQSSSQTGDLPDHTLHIRFSHHSAIQSIRYSFD